MTEEKQERILAFLVQSSNRDQLFPYLSESFFESPRQKSVFKLLHRLWKKHNSVPSAQEMKSLLLKAWKKESELVKMDWANRIVGLYTYNVTQATLEELTDTIVRQEVLNSLADAASDKSVHEIIADTRKKLDSLSGLISTSVHEDETCTMLSTGYLSDREKKMLENPPDTIKLGFERIDQACQGGGMLKGELVIVMAPSNTGKTMCLVNIAVNLLEQGYNVLFFNCDTTRDLIERRLYACVTGLSMNEEVCTSDLHDAIASWRSKYSIGDNAFIYKDLIPNSTTVGTIRGYVNQIDDKHGARDVLVIDYGDLILPDTKHSEKRHVLNDAFEGLRGLARDMNKLVVTATQTNRGGLDIHKDSVITMKNIAEGYGKVFPAALMIAINQTQAERTFDPPVARLSVPKNNKGERDFVVPVIMDYARAKMRPDTEGYVHKILNTDSSPSTLPVAPSIKIGSTKYQPKKPAYASYSNKSIADYPEPE